MPCAMDLSRKNHFEDAYLLLKRKKVGVVSCEPQRTDPKGSGFACCKSIHVVNCCWTLHKYMPEDACQKLVTSKIHSLVN